MVDPAVRMKAIEISVGFWRRLVIDGARALAGGGGNLWSIRKAANRASSEIFCQLAALGAENRPKDLSKVRKKIRTLESNRTSIQKAKRKNEEDEEAREQEGADDKADTDDHGRS